MSPIERLVARYVKLMATLVDNLTGGLTRLYNQTDKRSPSDVDFFATKAAERVAAAQEAAASTTAAYLAASLGALTGRQVPPPTIEPRQFTALRGTDPVEEYSRPHREAVKAADAGLSEPEVRDAGLRRLESLAATDVALARNHTARAVLSREEFADEVAGYRRILTGAENCGLCVVASTQRYHTGQLLPIHPACDCVVGVIVGDEDPGQIINTRILRPDVDPQGLYSDEDTIDAGQLLEPIHEAVRERFGVSDRSARQPIAYRDVLTVYEHGELGPTLAVKGHRRTSAGDVDTTRGPGKSSTAGLTGGPDAPREAPASDAAGESGWTRLMDRAAESSEEREELANELRRDLESQDFAGFEVQLEMDVSRVDVRFSGTVMRDGVAVGEVERQIASDDEGVLYAKHSYLEIDEAYQGQGFSTAWNNHLYSWYRDLGVEYVKVHANIDVGGYTWAAYGFDFEAEHDAALIVQRFQRIVGEMEAERSRLLSDGSADLRTVEQVDYLTSQISAADEILDRADSAPFHSEDFPTAGEFSQTGRDPAVEEWIGQLAMKGSSWHGRRWLI